MIRRICKHMGGLAPRQVDEEPGQANTRMSTPLFRKEALENHQSRWLGEVVLIRPLALSVLAALAALFGGLLLLFAFLGEYTRHSTVPGLLLPEGGLIKVYTPRPGEITRKFVTEGHKVRRGEALFALTSERKDSASVGIEPAISAEVQKRRQSLLAEISQTRTLHRQEHLAVRQRAATVQTERMRVVQQIEAQQSRLALAMEAVERHRSLQAQGFVSRAQADERREAQLEHEARLHGLQRELLRVDQDLASLQGDLVALPLKHQNQLAALERALSSAGQEFTESEARREIIIVAPEDGTVTAITATVGQSVDNSRSLATVVPEGTKLLAQLFVPSRGIGFVKPGDPVHLRYQAFPYQKFGHHAAVVREVSKVALAAQEFGAGAGMPASGSSGTEPLYRVVAELAEQEVLAYGRKQPLQPGMVLEADLLQETRRLYEWALEPLFSLSGKL